MQYKTHTTLTSGDGLIYIESRTAIDRCRREGGHFWPPGESTKEQTHLWAPYSCSRWITSADDSREGVPFLLTADFVVLVTV